MIIGLPGEGVHGERRVALVPAAIPALTKAGLEVWLAPGIGIAAGFGDEAYVAKGAKIAPGTDEVIANADVIVQIGITADAAANDQQTLTGYRPGQILIGLSDCLDHPVIAQKLAERGVILFALELIPRIARAQTMDMLSSMATIAGYKAVILAAQSLCKIFPMLTTAAGTLTPAKVLVLGAGVAGLQAIATARRLGAVVAAYDVRAAAAQDVQSLGARFIELAIEAEVQSEDAGGYARDLGGEFYQRQQESLAEVIAGYDVVIATAAVPGKRAPTLVSAAAARGMAPGSVIVDLAAERGGNCVLTRPGEIIEENGVTIMGPLNLPSTVPYHASQMVAKNMTAFLHCLVRDGAARIDQQDEIIRGTLVTMDHAVVHPRVRELLQTH